MTTDKLSYQLQLQCKKGIWWKLFPSLRQLTLTNSYVLSRKQLKSGLHKLQLSEQCQRRVRGSSRRAAPVPSGLTCCRCTSWPPSSPTTCSLSSARSASASASWSMTRTWLLVFQLLQGASVGHFEQSLVDSLPKTCLTLIPGENLCCADKWPNYLTEILWKANA